MSRMNGLPGVSGTKRGQNTLDGIASLYERPGVSGLYLIGMCWSSGSEMVRSTPVTGNTSLVLYRGNRLESSYSARGDGGNIISRKKRTGGTCRTWWVLHLSEVGVG